jgi:hypothetical protein
MLTHAAVLDPVYPRWRRIADQTESGSHDDTDHRRDHASEQADNADRCTDQDDAELGSRSV